MAKAKKKSTNAKSSQAKKTTKSNTKAATTKKAEATKKAPVKKAQANKKPEADKKVQAKHVSSNVKESPSNPWVVISIALALLILFLVAGIGYMYFNNQDNNPANNTNTTGNENQTMGDSITLLVIEDPSCVSCQVDLFATQIKENLISNLVVQKVSYDTQEGSDILSTLNAKQVPVYLFSKNIDERADWDTELKGAFLTKIISGTTYYMLNPQFVQGKVMIEEPTITENAIVIGDENAPVTLIEFTDYECPYCAIAEGNPELVESFKARDPNYTAPLPEVYKNYVETGKVKIVFYNFPIPSLHPKARETHNAALCANEQDSFKEYSSKLWEDRATWTAESDRAAQYKQYAKDLGLDETQFSECLDSKKYDSQITEEISLGQSLGVSGTPAFFIGKTFISGAQDYTTFKSIIDAQLEAQN